jgi:urease accessory protein
MLLIEQVIGSRFDPELSQAIHELEHRGSVDLLTVAQSDLSRRRFRARTRGGLEVAIALPRQQPLFDGAVLFLDRQRAVVVRMAEQLWLRLKASGVAEAIELGYHAGNLHWRVQFHGDELWVALEAPVEVYLRRIESLLANGRVSHALLSPTQS